jgi:hypothetical protein
MRCPTGVCSGTRACFFFLVLGTEVTRTEVEGGGGEGGGGPGGPGLHRGPWDQPDFFSREKKDPDP